MIYFKLKFFLFDNLKSKSKIYKKNKHKSNIPLEIKKKKDKLYSYYKCESACLIINQLDIDDLLL